MNAYEVRNMLRPNVETCMKLSQLPREGLRKCTFNCSESFTQVPGTFITEVVVSNKQLVESFVLLQKRRNCGAIGVCDLSTLQKEDTAVPKVMCADSKMRWYQIFTHWSGKVRSKNYRKGIHSLIFEGQKANLA